MRLDEGRLLKDIMREAMKLESRVKWVKDLRMGLEAFGRQGLDMQALSVLSMNEVKDISKCMTWRRAREGWREETRVHPKLEIMRRLMDCEYNARCVDNNCRGSLLRSSTYKQIDCEQIVAEINQQLIA